MKISKHSIVGQFHVLPFIKITYDRTLNGEYEFIVGWMSIGISLSFKPKQIWVKDFKSVIGLKNYGDIDTICQYHLSGFGLYVLNHL